MKPLTSTGRNRSSVYEIYEGDDALEKEDHFIQMMGDYNATKGGGLPPDPTGKVRSKQHCKNLSKSLTGLKHNIDQAGDKNPMYGKPPWNKGKSGVSEETRAKMRTAKLGKKQNLDIVTKRQISVRKALDSKSHEERSAISKKSWETRRKNLNAIREI